MRRICLRGHPFDALLSVKGSQYTRRLLLDWSEANDVRLSCSRTGNCHDNAVAESFFAILKNRMYHRTSLWMCDEARRAVTGSSRGVLQLPLAAFGARVPDTGTGDRRVLPTPEPGPLGRVQSGLESQLIVSETIDTGQPTHARNGEIRPR